MEVNPALIGSTLENYPLKTLLTSLAEGIAEAQSKLDENSIRTASQLMDRKLSIKNADGQTVEKSLMELGFMPTFYHFDSATIKVSVTITMKVEQSTSTSVGVSISVGHSTKSDKDLPQGGGNPAASSTGGGSEGETDAGDNAEGDGDSVTLKEGSFTLAQLQAKTVDELKSINTSNSLGVTTKIRIDTSQNRSSLGQKIFDAAKTKE